MLNTRLLGLLVLALLATNIITIGIGSIVFGPDWPKSSIGQEVRWIVNAIPIGVWAFLSTLAHDRELKKDKDDKLESKSVLESSAEDQKSGTISTKEND